MNSRVTAKITDTPKKMIIITQSNQAHHSLALEAVSQLSMISKFFDKKTMRKIQLKEFQQTQ